MGHKIRVVFVGDHGEEIALSCLSSGVTARYADLAYSWRDTLLEIPTISLWREPSNQQVGSNQIWFRQRVVWGAQTDGQRQQTYRNAKLIALCFSIVDPKSLESMHNRVSPAPCNITWVPSLILFESGCQKFAIIYQASQLSLLAQVLCREKR